MNKVVNRVEQTIIKRSHPMYKVIEDFSIRSNNFYNYALYHIRQEYINNRNWIRYQDMQKIMKDTEPYKLLMSQSSQCVLQVLDRNLKSFFQGVKKYNKNPSIFLGVPKLPKYREKGSRFTWFLKNNQIYIRDGKLYFMLKAMKKYGFKTNVKDRIISIRFVPRNDVFILEIIYEKEVSVKPESNDKIASIDLGLNNLITMTNNIGLSPVIIKGGNIKSINQYYNKLRAGYLSKLPKEIHWSKHLDVLTRRRYQKIKNIMHHNSNYIVKYYKTFDINTLIIGNNKEWKQEVNIGSKNNQNFVFIPYDMLIKQLEYKCEDSGICFILTEESYTSGTSFLDNELPIKESYNKKRRVKRGLFKSNNGILINSDVNGSFQIMKKVIPDVKFNQGIVGCLNPIVVNTMN